MKETEIAAEESVAGREGQPRIDTDYRSRTESSDGVADRKKKEEIHELDSFKNQQEAKQLTAANTERYDNAAERPTAKKRIGGKETGTGG